MKSYLTIALISMLILSACSSITVTSDYDKSVDFTQFKTYSYYGWAKESNKILTPFDQQRIEQAFADEFSKRGLKYVKEGGDLTVALYIQTEKKQETTATTTGMGGYGGYYGWGPGWGWGPGFYGGMTQTTYHTYDYQVGTLVVDVFDTKKKVLIWESAGQGRINENPSTRDKSIPKVVAQIMATYPVQPIKSK
ncbi:MAG: DUF4136 domain-containing protein [Chlorobi bacterium]|nr:DUF4136 domain-containing protein [Chlorobiota bacterium]